MNNFFGFSGGGGSGGGGGSPALTTNQIGVGIASVLGSYPSFKYDGTNFQINSGISFSSNYTSLGYISFGSNRQFALIASQNTATNGLTGFIFGESDTALALFAKNGSTVSGTFSGTTVAQATVTYFQSGSGFDMPIHFAGSVITAQTRASSGNTGIRLDTIGLTVTTNANINTPNTRTFQVNGSINVNVQTGNSGLSTGDVYQDTAANILTNGDRILAIKV